MQSDISIHAPVANLFNIPRHDIPSNHDRELRAAAMQMWNEIACLQAIQARALTETFDPGPLTLQCRRGPYL